MKSQNNDAVKESKTKPGKDLLVLLVSILILAAWIFVLNWLSAQYLDQNYFEWFIKQGTIISIATSFLALVWEGLEEQKNLLSWHPARFLRSCFVLSSVFYEVLSANLAGSVWGLKKQSRDLISSFEVKWDGVLALIMNIAMGIVVFAWLIVIAPLFYFITLITGAPARRSIRDTGVKIIINEGEDGTVIKEESTSVATPKGWVDVSFGQRPFALTNALNAGVLFLVDLIIF